MAKFIGGPLGGRIPAQGTTPQLPPEVTGQPQVAVPVMLQDRLPQPVVQVTPPAPMPPELQMGLPEDVEQPQAGYPMFPPDMEEAAMAEQAQPAAQEQMTYPFGYTEDTDLAASLAEDDAARVEYERQRQAESVAYKNYDYSTIEQIQEAFPDIKKTEVSPIHRAAVDMSESLLMTNIGRTITVPSIANRIPDATDGFQMMAQMSDAEDPKEVASMMATTAAVLTQRLVNPKSPEAKVQNDSIMLDLLGGLDADESMDDFWKSDDSSDSTDAQFDDKENSGRDPDNFAREAGKLMQRIVNKPQFDEQGNYIGNKSPAGFDRDVAGALAFKAMQDAGIIQLKTVVNNAGKPVQRVFLNPVRGAEFRKSARNVAQQFQQQTRSISQIVPVTPEGSYVGPQAGERRKEKRTKEQTIADEIRQATTTLGRVPLSIVPEADFYRRWLMQKVQEETQDINPDGTPAGTFHTAPNDGWGSLFKVNEGSVQAEAEDVNGINKLVNQKMNMLNIRNQLYTNNLIQGVPRYAYHWTDATVNRVYNDSTDANLQANKDARAIYGPPPKLMQLSKDEFHKRGVSEKEAEAFWKSLEDPNKVMSTRDNELSFLMTTGHALGKLVGANPDAMVGYWILSDLITPENLRKWAEQGRALKNAIPKTEEGQTDRVKVASAPAVLTPEAEQVMNDLKPFLGDDNWGFILRGLMSVADYMDAKESGKSVFTPRVTSAIDQNSAGRSFSALDIGDTDVLYRTGVLWETLDNLFGQSTAKKTTLPYGTPRTFFMDMVLDRGIQKAIGESGSSKEELLTAVQNVYKKYANNPAFAKDFGKKPLMTTDYGKPARFHFDATDAVFKKYPEFREELLAAMQADNPNATVVDARNLNTDIYRTTLNSVIDYAASNGPKLAQRFANLLGQPLDIKGFYGEPVSLSAYTMEGSDDYITIRGIDPNQDQKIKLTTGKAIRDLNRRAKKKTIDGEEYDPRPGSFQINSIGPWLGQYRESIVTSGLINQLNPKMVSPNQVQWIQTVHDNAIMDSFSFAKGLYAGNNIVTPKAMMWSPAKAVVDAANKMFADAKDIAKSEANVDGKIDVGTKGNFPLFLVELDYDYQNLKRKVDEKQKLTPKEKAYMDLLDDPRSGFKHNDNPSKPDYYSDSMRNELFITQAQYARLVQAFMARHNVKEVLNEWAIEGDKNKQQILSKILQQARKGRIAFFN